MAGAERLACCQLKIEGEVGSLRKMGTEGLNGSWGERVGQRHKQFLSVCHGSLEYIYRLRSQ